MADNGVVTPITLTGLALTSSAAEPLIAAQAGDYNTGAFTPSTWSDASTICGDILYEITDTTTGAVIDWVTVETSPTPLLRASPTAGQAVGDYEFKLRYYSPVYEDATQVIPEEVIFHVLVSSDCVIRSFTGPTAASLDLTYYVWADPISVDMTGLFLPEPDTCSTYSRDEVFTWTIPSSGAAYITNYVNSII